MKPRQRVRQGLDHACEHAEIRNGLNVEENLTLPGFSFLDFSGFAGGEWEVSPGTGQLAGHITAAICCRLLRWRLFSPLMRTPSGAPLPLLLHPGIRLLRLHFKVTGDVRYRNVCICSAYSQ